MRELLEQRIIGENVSPYNSPLWIVPKKSDNSERKKWRIVIDYITVSDKFPIPNIDTMLVGHNILLHLIYPKSFSS